jgi:hypothetical protein
MPRTLHGACTHLLEGIAGGYLAQPDRRMAPTFGAGVFR